VAALFPSVKFCPQFLRTDRSVFDFLTELDRLCPQMVGRVNPAVLGLAQ
jgi:hypothetical protein